MKNIFGCGFPLILSCRVLLAHVVLAWSEYFSKRKNRFDIDLVEIFKYVSFFSISRICYVNSVQTGKWFVFFCLFYE